MKPSNNNQYVDLHTAPPIPLRSDLVPVESNVSKEKYNISKENVSKEKYNVAKEKSNVSKEKEPLKASRTAPPPPPPRPINRKDSSEPRGTLLPGLSESDGNDNKVVGKRESISMETDTGLQERRPSLKIKSYPKYQEQSQRRRSHENNPEKSTNKPKTPSVDLSELKLASDNLNKVKKYNDVDISKGSFKSASESNIKASHPAAPPRPLQRISVTSNTISGPVAPPRRKKSTPTSPLNIDDIGNAMNKLIAGLDVELNTLSDNSPVESPSTSSVESETTIENEPKKVTKKPMLPPRRQPSLTPKQRTAEPSLTPKQRTTERTISGSGFNEPSLTPKQRTAERTISGGFNEVFYTPNKTAENSTHNVQPPVDGKSKSVQQVMFEQELSKSSLMIEKVSKELSSPDNNNTPATSVPEQTKHVPLAFEGNERKTLKISLKQLMVKKLRKETIEIESEPYTAKVCVFWLFYFFICFSFCD